MSQYASSTFLQFDTQRVPSPCFVVDEVVIEQNLKRLQSVHINSGAKVLAALKAFCLWDLASLYSPYVSGTCASGLNETLLAKEFYRGEVHVFSAAFSEQELMQVSDLCDHLVLNSFSQWQRFKPLLQHQQYLRRKQKRSPLSIGLRINPEHSECEIDLYDPCAPCSRLGIPAHQFENQDLSGINGLHFHSLCEHGFAALDRTLNAVETKFGHLFDQLQWINFGGGHLITEPGYDIDALVNRIITFSKCWGLQVYLEPGEAVAIRSGVLVAEVLDTLSNGHKLAILDTSATCHMPDVLEMPYRPTIFHAGASGEKKYTYRLGGTTCLAGDIIGDFSFDSPLNVGQRILFDDMAHYTMVKTTTFNGINLPSIAVWNSTTDALRIVKTFGYDDFRNRLS